MASSEPLIFPSTTPGTGTAAPAANTSTTTAMKPKMRRAKGTACLTCRNRRIKCGNERPTCKNCIKSNRQCEWQGDNQREIFKQSIRQWPNQPKDTLTHAMHSTEYDGDCAPRTPKVVSPKPEDLLKFEAFMSRELPGSVRQALGTTLEPILNLIQETLKNKLESIVRNCQESLTRSYMGNVSTPNANKDDEAQLAMDRDVLAPYTVPPDFD